MDPTRIAFIGAGNMGRALIGGLLRSGVPRERIRVGEAVEACRASLAQELDVQASRENHVAVQEADVVVLAVKPQDAAQAMRALGPQLAARRPLVLSVAAGVRLRALAAWCGAGVPIVRAMPNRPALVGAGVSGAFAPATVSAAQRLLAEQVLHAVGGVVWVAREEDLDTVTALSGSGPAYFFLLAELMMQAAVRLGLEPSAARTLAVETLHGSGRLAHASDGDLARLRAEVTSKGGTTEAALRVFAAADLGTTVTQALAAAARRGGELADEFGSQQ